MADSSLDDFFAKKDKSKKKSKKFASGEQSGMNFDQDAGGRKDSGSGYQRGSAGSKKDKEKNSNVSSSGGSNYTQKTSEQEDDEWIEVHEKETDYTGLKIQNLQISELRDEEYEKEKMEERNAEDGDHSGQRDGSGPWNKSSGTPTPTSEIPETTEARQEEKEKPAAATKYVAPGQRAGGGSSLSSVSRSRSKHAPEIDDEMHFPSLSSAADGRKKGYPSDADRGFESVKRGGSRTMDESGRRGPQLDLDNKYDALSSGETS